MMDSNLQSLPHDNTDTKNTFRKPSGDSSHRNYRRHSPADGLLSSDGSPKRELSPDPNPSRGGSINVSNHHARKDDGKEEDRDYGKNHHGRSSDSFRHSDRQSSRSSYGHSRNEDYTRHDRYADEDRYCERLSSRAGLESKGDHSREGSDNRSKDHLRTADKYSRDKYDRSEYRGSDCRSKEKDRESFSEYLKCKGKDSLYERSGSGRKHSPYGGVERERRTRDSDYRDERRDSHRSYRDYRSDRVVSYSESRSQRDDSGSQKDSAKYRLKEAYESEQKEMDSKRFGRDLEIGEYIDRNTRKDGEQISNEDKESSAKKTKLFGTEYDESQTSSSKHPQESNVNLGTAQASGSEVVNDLNSAKVAAMKAAELVNKNLVGTGAGCLTTDQKKKLLWGNKKNTQAEESGHRWDTAQFSDRERQEKFNKLMSLRLHWCLWPIVGCEGRPKGGAKIQRPKCGEAEGAAPDGSGEAVHCGSSSERWSYSWIRSLNIRLRVFPSFDLPVHHYASLLGRILLLVCFIGEYGLMSDIRNLVAVWWEFSSRHKLVYVVDILVIVCQVLFCNSYKTDFDIWDLEMFKITF